MADSQLNKHSRRKRKDPESRDFSCRCGKSYLSYAAAYTHVKNKHKSQKEFLVSIVKPERQPLKRGRPRQRKPMSNTAQTQSLSIVQQAILNLYNIFKQSRESDVGKIILQGNEENDEQDINEQYKKLMDKKPVPQDIFSENPKKSFHHILEFQQGLNKHFSSSIAAKVRWHLNYIVYKHFNPVKKEQQDNAFDRHPLETSQQNNESGEQYKKINNQIYEALKKWTTIKDRKQQE